LNKWEKKLTSTKKARTAHIALSKLDNSPRVAAGINAKQHNFINHLIISVKRMETDW
jgi:hypothetical protein